MGDLKLRYLVQTGNCIILGAFRIGAVSAALNASPTFAHHSFNAVFAMDLPVSLDGTVTRFDFINPHGFIYLDVADETGSVSQWKIEITNPNELLRRGWSKDTLKPGDVITVNGPRARDGSNYAMGSTITLPDGREIFGTSANAER